MSTEVVCFLDVVWCFVFLVCVSHPVEVDGHPGEENKVALPCHAMPHTGVRMDWAGQGYV